MKKLILLLIILCAWTSIQAQDDSFWEHDYDSAQYIASQYVFAVFDKSHNPPKRTNQINVDLRAIMVFSSNYLNIYLDKSTIKYVVIGSTGYKESNFDSDGDEYEWLKYAILDERGREGILTIHNYIKLIDTYFFLIFDNVQHSYFTHLEKYHRNEIEKFEKTLPVVGSGIRAMVY